MASEKGRENRGKEGGHREEEEGWTPGSTNHGRTGGWRPRDSRPAPGQWLGSADAGT